MSYENKGSLVATVTVSRETDRSGNFVCTGITDDVELQAAITYVSVLGGGVILVGLGTYTVTADVDVAADITFKGVGKTATIFNFTAAAQLRVVGDNVHLEGFGVTGSGGIIYQNSDHITTIDVRAETEDDFDGAFRVAADGVDVVDYTFINCEAESDCIGFSMEGVSVGEDEWFRDFRFFNCRAIDCGKNAPRYNDWVVGFDFNESIVSGGVENLWVIGCHAEGSWESGFHFEDAPTKNNCWLIGCTSKENGRDKPAPEYASGFYIGGDGVRLLGCRSENNGRYGYSVIRDDGEGVTISDCEDIGSDRYGLRVYGGTSELIIDNVTLTDNGRRGFNFENTSNVIARQLISINPTGFGQIGNLIGDDPANPVTDSTFEIILREGGAGAQFALYCNGLERTVISGDFRPVTVAVNPVCLYLTDMEDVQLKDMYIDFSGAFAINGVNNLTDCRVSNTFIEDTAAGGLTTGIEGNSELILDWPSTKIKDATTSFTNCITDKAPVATGEYTGDGTLSQAITGVGFKPMFLMITPDGFDGDNFDVPAPNIKYEGFPDGWSIAQLLRSNTDDTIETLDADGFTVNDGGTDLHPNKLNQVYFYVALGLWG